MKTSTLVRRRNVLLTQLKKIQVQVEQLERLIELQVGVGNKEAYKLDNYYCSVSVVETTRESWNTVALTKLLGERAAKYKRHTPYTRLAITPIKEATYKRLQVKT